MIKWLVKHELSKENDIKLAKKAIFASRECLNQNQVKLIVLLHEYLLYTREKLYFIVHICCKT